MWQFCRQFYRWTSSVLNGKDSSFGMQINSESRKKEASMMTVLKATNGHILDITVSVDSG